MINPVVRQIIAWCAFLGLWQAGSHWTAPYALPGPSAILWAIISDRSLLAEHSIPTLTNAAIGLTLGVFVGILLGIGLRKSPAINAILYGPALCLFTVPLVALAPLLALMLPAGSVPIALAAITIFFPLAVATQRALADVDLRQRLLFQIYTTRRLHIFTLLEIPSALPGIMAGIQIAIPWAVLGAMLGEFVGGRWGLGVLMLGTLGRGDPARLWAIAVVATLISVAAFSTMGLARRIVEKRLGVSGIVRDLGAVTEGPGFRVLTMAIVSSLIAWFLFDLVSPLPTPIVLGPIQVFEGLRANPDVVADLGEALRETLPTTIAALCIGVSVAVLWALLGRLYSTIGRVFTSVVFITQAVPLLALAPLFVLLLGRGLLTTITIAVLAIVFPGYAVVAQRLDTIPQGLEALSDLYASSNLKRAWAIDLPWAAYGVSTAVRIAAPRVLLGVMLAEYLATGRGLGFLMATARGRLDFVEIWAAVALTAFIGLVLYYVADFLEYVFNQKSASR